jgi:YHS domain-containing protein
MNAFKSLIGGIALSAALVTSALAAGVDVNATTTGLALRGYDPVAYHTVGEPTPGDFQITATYNDATYRFASEENKATFEANPEAYVPAYGGYCAFGTAMGFKFDGDPEIWKIVDDKLYLNLSAGVQERWEGDVPGFIEKASTNWVDIADKTPEELQAQ